MFLWSFLFLASPCARSHPCGLGIADRGGEAPSQPVARGWGQGRPQHRSGAQEVFRRRGSSAARLLQPRGSPGPTPPNLSGSASSRPAAGAPRCRARTGQLSAPPGSTVGATLSSRGPARGGGRCRLSPSVGRRGSRHQCRPAPCTLGHPPAHGLGVRGGRRRLPRRGSLRARLGFEELIESPLPTQVGFGCLVKGKYTALPGSPFPRARKDFMEHHAPVASSKAYLGKVSRSLF